MGMALLVFLLLLLRREKGMALLVEKQQEKGMALLQQENG
jgi:hypothetical protein